VAKKKVSPISSMLDRIFTPSSTHVSFSGAVLIAQKGKILLNKGYGFADVKKTVKITSRTRFNTDAITVGFTGTAIMQLQEQGKLSVHDQMCTYLTACPLAWQPITVEELLDCTSGIYDPINQDSSFERSKATSAAQYIADAASHPLNFAPGTTPRSSCNPNFVILASIIEKVSGITYPTYVQDHLLQPFGLRQSGVLQPGVSVPGLATPNDGTNAAPSGYLDGAWIYGLGGLYSTAGDLFRWDRALLAGKIVTRGSRDAMFTSHPPGAGYAWDVVTTLRGHRAAIAGGGTPYDGTADVIFPDSGTVIIILGNRATNLGVYINAVAAVMGL
jgi:CubicO group peptidase (beta-lactamase class C family)